MLSPEYFLCLIPFEQPGLFYPWFEWVRRVPKCSRFTAPLTQWFAFISLLGPDCNSTVPSALGMGTSCTAPRTEQVKQFVSEGRARWKKKLKSHKARSLCTSFADTWLLKFKLEAYVECHHALTDPYTTCKKNLMSQIEYKIASVMNGRRAN